MDTEAFATLPSVNVEAPSHNVGSTSRRHLITTGHLLFAFGLAGLGALSTGSGDFAYTWQPVPNWVPWRELLAHLSGLLLITLSVGMLLTKFAGRASRMTALYLASWVFLLQSPHVIKAPLSVGAWLGVCENLVLTCGAWILALSLLKSDGGRTPKLMLNVRLAQFLFGASCIIFGLSHFAYADFTAQMVPSWLPHRLFLAYLTGAFHLSAGVAVVSRVYRRLAAILEAVMISSFVVLVHMPEVLVSPLSRPPWTALFVASALAGASWLVAGSFRQKSELAATTYR